MPTFDCNIAEGFNVFEFDISAMTALTVPPTLEIKNCEFRNFLMEFNSFIEVPEFGGHIIIQDSVFDRVSSCGSILRNFKSSFSFNARPNEPQSEAENTFLRTRSMMYT